MPGTVPAGPCSALPEACHAVIEFRQAPIRPDVVVSLPASQQCVLNEIERALLSDDPRLGTLFAVFSRLMRDQAMPATEHVGAGLRRPAVVILLIVIVLAGVLMLGISIPGRPVCGVPPAAAGDQHAASRLAPCPPGPAMRLDRQSIR
jgi:hypothetical protein